MGSTWYIIPEFHKLGCVRPVCPKNYELASDGSTCNPVSDPFHPFKSIQTQLTDVNQRIGSLAVGHPPTCLALGATHQLSFTAPHYKATL